MQKPVPMMFALQELVSDLSLIARNHHVLRSDRSETDIDHSFSVVLLCWYVHSNHDIPLDLNKIFKYAIVHDFAERYAGDINTYASEADLKSKIAREEAAVEKLSMEFVEFGDMVESLKRYQAKADEEALFVWTVDKMQAIILAELDDWRPYKKIKINYDTFVKKHHEQLSRCSPYCKQIFEALLEYCKATHYDRPQK